MPTLVSVEARAELTRLHPRAGDLLVVTMPAGTRPEVCHTATAVVEAALAELGVRGVAVVGIPANVRLEMATDAALERLGLQRVKQPKYDFMFTGGDGPVLSGAQPLVIEPVAP